MGLTRQKIVFPSHSKEVTGFECFKLLTAEHSTQPVDKGENSIQYHYNDEIKDIEYIVSLIDNFRNVKISV